MGFTSSLSSRTVELWARGTLGANHDRLIWRSEALRYCADGRLHDHTAESGSILSLRSAPFSRVVEPAPARLIQHFAAGWKWPARGGGHGVPRGVAQHRLRRGTRAKNQDLLRGLLQKLFGARATSHTSTFFVRVSTALQSHRTGLQKILRRRPPGGCSRSPGDQRRARRDVRLRASSQRWTPRVETSSHGRPVRTFFG